MNKLQQVWEGGGRTRCVFKWIHFKRSMVVTYEPHPFRWTSILTHMTGNIWGDVRCLTITLITVSTIWSFFCTSMALKSVRAKSISVWTVLKPRWKWSRNQHCLKWVLATLLIWFEGSPTNNTASGIGIVHHTLFPVVVQHRHFVQAFLNQGILRMGTYKLRVHLQNFVTDSNQ